MKIIMGMMESGVTIIGKHDGEYVKDCLSILTKDNQIYMSNVIHEVFTEKVDGNDFETKIKVDKFMYMMDVEGIGNSETLTENYNNYFKKNVPVEIPVIENDKICIGITSALLPIIGKMDSTTNILKDSLIAFVNKDQKTGQNTITLAPIINPAFGVRLISDQIKTVNINMNNLISIFPIKDLALEDKFMKSYIQAISGLRL